MLVGALAMAGSASAWAAPTIFRASESAAPGSVIEIQGSDFGSSPAAWIAYATGPAGGLTPTQSLTVLSKSDTVVTAQIPANFSNGLYAVWVASSGVLSQPVVVNLPRINQIEFPEVEPSRTFRLFGRNLSLGAFTPSVQFVDGFGNSLAGVAVSGDAYAFSIQAPSNLVPGRTYTINFVNGAGGAWSAATFPVPARSGGSDPYALGVPWGADYSPWSANVYNVKTDVRLTPWAAGNGTTDDRAAIQNAIDVASAAGGGEVYLPNGVYNVATFASNIGLTMKSNVVLRGQSRAGTTLEFSPTAGSSYVAEMIHWDVGATATGLYNLTVLNNTTYELYTDDDSQSPGVSEVFVKDVTVDLNKWGKVVSFEESDRVLLDNVLITNPSRQGETLRLHQPGSTLRTSRYAIVRGSQFPKMARRLSGGLDTLFEGNTFTYDGDYQAELTALQPGFEGGEQNSLEIRNGSVLLNNTFQHVGVPFFSNNDGESILNQEQPANDANALQYDVGSATSGTSTTLADTAKSWGALSWAGFVVAIVDGPGTGQWRRIVWSNSTSVAVSPAWQVPPAAGSRYTLTKFGIQTVLIKGNTLTNRERGVWFYTGCQDVAVVDNDFTNAAGIWIRAFREHPNHLIPAWDVLIADNDVTRTSGPRPAHITVSASELEDDVVGSSVLGVEVRGNSIVADRPEVTYDMAPILREGYTAAATYRTDAAVGSPDWTKASLRGVVFDGNAAANVDDVYHLTSGVYQTTIADSQVSGIGRLIQDWGTYDGLLRNGAAWGAGDSQLRYGNGALVLDGVDDRVSLGLEFSWGSSRLRLGPQFTLEARVKTTGTGTHTILDLAAGPAASPQWAVNGGKLLLHSRAQYWLVGTASVNDGNWHHVALTYDGADVRFYVDGALDSTFPASLSSELGYGSSLGANADGNWAFPGSIDEVRIWNVARSATEILANSNRELEGSEPGLTNYWRLNEGTGTWANDAAFAASIDSVPRDAVNRDPLWYVNANAETVGSPPSLVPFSDALTVLTPQQLALTDVDDTVTVVTAGGGLSKQPLQIVDAGRVNSGFNDSQPRVQFDGSVDLAPAGKVRVEWDSSIASAGVAGDTLLGMTVRTNLGNAKMAIAYRQDNASGGGFLIFGADWVSVPGTWTVNVPQHFGLDLDLDNDTYSLAIDGTPALTNQLFKADGTPLGPFTRVDFGNMAGFVGGSPALLGAFTATVDNLVVSLPP